MMVPGNSRTATAPADEAVSDRSSDPSTRGAQAQAIIQRNVLWALGAGATPVPIVDMLAVSGVQLKMLKELSDLYGVAFRADIVKKLLGTLFAGVGGIGVGVALGGSIAKLIPAVGTALGIVTVPIVAGAFTHATGQVFVVHFESGGTLLTFDAERLRAHFRAEFEAAKAKVAEIEPIVAPQATKPPPVKAT
jgi:uncharacterized protein (DUF697 family)